MIQDVVGEKAVTVRLEPQVYRRVELLARREKRSISSQIAYLVEQALEALPQEVAAELDRTTRTKKPRGR
jgi:hypothetical protein